MPPIFDDQLQKLARKLAPIITPLIAQRLGGGGSSSLPSGSAFPVAPTVGDLFYHTGYRTWFYCSALSAFGDRSWETVQEYSTQIVLNQSFSANTRVISQSPLNRLSQAGTVTFLDLRHERVPYRITLGTNNASNYWTLNISAQGVPILSIATNGLFGGQTFTATELVPLASAYPGPDDALWLDVVPTGSPGAINISMAVHYRLIVLDY